MKLAVLLATFNRKDKTICCLKALYAQQLPKGTLMDVYLTDDASSDGTPEAVIAKFPSVNLLKGNGQLYWAGGMRNTWNAALSGGYDFYLLLNDDTLLESEAITELMACYFKHLDTMGPSICVGTTKDSETGKISYGGQRLYRPTKVQSYNIYSDVEYEECDMANANIMLVPQQVVQAIGTLSERYTHSIADFDYSIRAKKAGYKSIVVPGILGLCTDDHGKNWKSSDSTLSERIQYLKSPKGLSYTEYMYFIKTHFPSHRVAAFFKLWMKTLFPLVWDKFKK